MVADRHMDLATRADDSCRPTDRRTKPGTLRRMHDPARRNDDRLDRHGSAGTVGRQRRKGGAENARLEIARLENAGTDWLWKDDQA